MQSPQQIRQYYRQQRRLLNTQQQADAAHAISTRLLSLLAPDDVIAGYLAHDGEIDLQPFIQQCWQQQLKVVLPVLHPFNPGQLVFVHYRQDTRLHPNRYGILEPQLACHQLVPLSQITLILAPLVAFDSNGNRMGMGGGFYDRTLSTLARHKQNTRVFGVAHHCQQAPRLIPQPWDMPVQKIITDQQIIDVT